MPCRKGPLPGGAHHPRGGPHRHHVHPDVWRAVQKLPTYPQDAFSFIYPVVAIFVDYAAFGHQLKPLQLLGAATIVLSAMGMTFGWRLIRQKAPASP